MRKRKDLRVLLRAPRDNFPWEKKTATLPHAIVWAHDLPFCGAALWRRGYGCAEFGHKHLVVLASFGSSPGSIQSGGRPGKSNRRFHFRQAQIERTHVFTRSVAPNVDPPRLLRSHRPATDSRGGAAFCRRS